MQSLFIAVPMYSGKADFQMFESMLDAQKMLMEHGVDVEVRILPLNPYLAQARSTLMAEFLDSQKEYCLFIDDDLCFTKQDIIKVMNWPDNPEHIYSGLYRFRYPNQKNAVYTPIPGLLPDADGIVEVQEIAGGFFRFSRIVADYMESKYQDCICMQCTRMGRQIVMVFETGPDTDRRFTGEDYVFSRRAHDCGFRLFADTTVRLGHIGRYVYQLPDENNPAATV